MNVKRILSCVLALALAASLLPGLVSAPAAASFSDIADDATAENVEVLRMLGVVDGVGNGAFRPGGTLTRAQFCKMAVVKRGLRASTRPIRSSPTCAPPTGRRAM